VLIVVTAAKDDVIAFQICCGNPVSYRMQIDLERKGGRVEHISKGLVSRAFTQKASDLAVPVRGIKPHAFHELLVQKPFRTANRRWSGRDDQKGRHNTGTRKH